jgi:proteasome activator subunit 3 (PA28 gamma)
MLLQIALREHDEKQFYMALRNLIDLRNIYAVLTDVIHKNFQKVSMCVPSLDLY